MKSPGGLLACAPAVQLLGRVSEETLRGSFLGYPEMGA